MRNKRGLQKWPILSSPQLRIDGGMHEAKEGKT